MAHARRFVSRARRAAEKLAKQQSHADIHLVQLCFAPSAVAPKSLMEFGERGEGVVGFAASDEASSNRTVDFFVVNSRHGNGH